MKLTPQMKFALGLVALTAFAAGAANAAVIAATDFDGRGLATTTLANDTATNLNWVLNGVEDPGSMTAAAEDDRSFPGLFNGNTLTQNLFAPAINVGNLNIGWRTSVDLTVSAGSIVTLTEVTFLYAGISGGQALQGVLRRSDFTIALFDPSANLVDSVFLDNVDNVPNGLAAVSAVFPAPLALDAPGTYTLEILADEAPETGNHIGIDNLSINGDVIPEPSAFLLSGLGLIALLARRRR